MKVVSLLFVSRLHLRTQEPGLVAWSRQTDFILRQVREGPEKDPEASLKPFMLPARTRQSSYLASALG